MVFILDIISFSKETNTVKEKLDENQIDKLKDIRNLVSNEFQKY